MNMSDNFINIPFSSDNLDRYFIRISILKALKSNLPDFKDRLLDVGCGKMPYRDFIKENSKITDYIGLDIDTALCYDENIKPDYTWDGKVMPFGNNTFDTVMATEVLEHCPEPVQVLKEIYRVLDNDGFLYLTVPFLWPLHETPHDEYRYTPYSLERLLKEAGFRNIVIKATGGWHASLAQLLGLWVRRSGISDRKKKYLSKILKPVIKFLIKKDTPPVDFYEGLMIPSLYISAIK